MTKNRNVVLKALFFSPNWFLPAVLLLMTLILSAPAWAEEKAVRSDRWLDLPFDVSGSYRADYYGRWNTDDANDQQLFQYLTVHVNNIMPEDKLSVHFLGRVSAELNGREDGDEFFFDDLDTWADDLNLRVYYLYAEMKDPLFEQSDLRVGRMYSYESETVFFTGAKYEQTIEKLRFYVQGGFDGSNYDSSQFDEDETIGGLGADYQLFPNTSLGYDFLRVVDHNLDDTYHDFNITQRFGSLKTYAQVSFLNTEVDDVNLYGSYYYTPLDLNLTARYYGLINARKQLTTQFSALVDLDAFDAEDDDTVGTLFPFNLVTLSAYKGWGERYATTVGYETRWMEHDDERNNFNREYDRYYVTFEMWDVLVKGLTTGVTFEYWDADASEDSIAAGIDVEKKVSERLDVGGGFYYSRYRIGYTYDGENFSDEIETPELYARVRYQWKDNVKLLARYEVEHEDDLETTHRVRLGVEIDF